MSLEAEDGDRNSSAEYEEVELEESKDRKVKEERKSSDTWESCEEEEDQDEVGNVIIESK